MEGDYLNNQEYLRLVGELEILKKEYEKAKEEYDELEKEYYRYCSEFSPLDEEMFSLDSKIKKMTEKLADRMPIYKALTIITNATIIGFLAGNINNIFNISQEATLILKMSLIAFSGIQGVVFNSLFDEILKDKFSEKLMKSKKYTKLVSERDALFKKIVQKDKEYGEIQDRFIIANSKRGKAFHEKAKKEIEIETKFPPSFLMEQAQKEHKPELKPKIRKLINNTYNGDDRL